MDAEVYSHRWYDSMKCRFSEVHEPIVPSDSMKFKSKPNQTELWSAVWCGSVSQFQDLEDYPFHHQNVSRMHKYLDQYTSFSFVTRELHVIFLYNYSSLGSFQFKTKIATSWPQTKLFPYGFSFWKLKPIRTSEITRPNSACLVRSGRFCDSFNFCG